MRVEIHVRPMILPLLEGKEDSQNRYEVDVWFFLREGVGEVCLETVVDNREQAEKLVEELQAAMRDAEVIQER